ncbi:GNAT family N-acetyltransferase [Aestuariispira ectoiniformans]|uniref:GNAT family N-acetyltransferase n=1 Tax=Aestuariispira ectoiniformans TaxID=2775080 RepID=UPI00223B9F76|nr:GNAT family N-acetyltransferase [Aestuariispira ectoiniformans]
MITIEKAVPGDFPALVDLWEGSVRATHDFLTEEDIAFFRNGLLNEWLEAVGPYCARNDDGEILGFVAVVEGNIEMLFIDASRRGQGVGKALFNFARTSLQATKVDVNEQNRQGVDFYRHIGFDVIGRSEKDSTGKPYPLLHMQLSA